MSDNKLYSATVIKTGELVKVYKSKSKENTYVNYQDCTTDYKSSELADIVEISH